MDSIEPIQSGKMSTRLAVIGRDGRLRRPVCVDVAWLPSGNVTETGLFDGRTSKMARQSFIAMKWPVVPVSAFASVGSLFGA